ncbi:hypothetical protein [Marinomonas epiphytica]
MIRFLSASLISLLAMSAYAECPDLEARQTANKIVTSQYNGKVFRAALVLKKHLPSKRKEVATYIQINDLYYTVFLLIDTQCNGQIIKRTKGKY